MNPNQHRRLSNAQIGLIAVVLTVIGFYLAFTKSIPFTGDGYQLKAVFSDAQNIRAKSPVRISGVDVGEVTDVQHLVDENGNGQDAAVVTMKIDDSARPIRQDTTMALRPRLFLEGNLFVDLHPGSPGAPELESGSVIPQSQTSVSVQFDEVLTTLQAPVRRNLQIFFQQLGDALDRYGGGKGLQESFRTSPAAYRYTAEVNEALLGTQPGDLAGFISNLDIVARDLNADSTALQGLISNLNSVSGAFAAHQASLREAIIELPRTLAAGRPALFKLNRALPPLRAFAREALPGVKAANSALDHANPWIGQVRQLISEAELRGLVKDLRPTIPDLAALSRASLPFLEEIRLLSSCFNNVVIPWSNTEIPNSDSDPPAARVFQETAYGLVGVAGESRSGDGNGQEFRVLGGGGTNTIAPFSTPEGALTGVVPFAFQGSQPAKQSSRKTPFRPDVPCETQEPPDLHSDIGDAPETTETSASSAEAQYYPPQVEQLRGRYPDILQQLAEAEKLKSLDPAAAKQLTEQGLEEYAAWVREWNAVGKSVGLNLPQLPSPTGVNG